MFEKAVQARELYRQGKFKQAEALYEEFVKEYPDFAQAYTPETLDEPPVDVAVDGEEPTTLDDLYQQVSDASAEIDWTQLEEAPLVTVVMTAYNVEDYVEAAITSVIRQTWRNLEVVVVDDCSTDKTNDVLARLARVHRNLTHLRLNTNLGTYYAKNVGITRAKGRYIFFHDSDDICHPERIRLSMWHLLQERGVAVRGVTSRVTYPEGRVLLVNGRVARRGYITLGVARSVFDEIGYFNCTTKAADDEFAHRLTMYLKTKKQRIIDIKYPYYYLTYRDGSLSSDMIQNNPVKEGAVVRKNSLSRALYKEVFTDAHTNLPVSALKETFRFPTVRDALPCPADMTKLANPRDPVVASLCSIPSRSDALVKTLRSIEKQVDHIYLYLDGYDRTPGYVYELSCEVTVVHSRDVPNLRDNGKFYPLQKLNKDCYFFTMDDDIVYPPDYVNAMIKKLDFYEQAVAVGVHGVFLPENAERYFSGFRKSYHFKYKLESDTLVSNLGTGTVAFHTRYFSTLSVEEFSETGMSDIYFSIFCKNHGIPMVCIARPDDWLCEVIPEDTNTLYHEFKRADDKQAALVADNRPWGIKAFHQVIDTADERLSDKLAKASLRGMIPYLNRFMI